MKDAKENNEVAERDATVYDAEVVGEETPSSGGVPQNRAQRALWMDLLIIIAVYIGSTIIFGVIVGLFAGVVGGNAVQAGLVGNILIYAVTIPVAVWILRQRGIRGPVLSFSLRKFNPLLVLWGFLLIFIMGVVIEPLLALFPASYMDNVNKMILEGGGLGMFTAVIAAPVLEEMLFRGVIQGGASREYRPMKAILISAAVFGVVHFVPQQVVNAFFCGIIMGYVYYRTGSLVPVIAIHLLNNAVAYITIRMAPESAGETMRALVGNDTWYWIIYAACAVIFVFALVNLWRQLNRADEKALLEAK